MKKSVTIYASELAACVGFNKFTSVEDAALKVFSRTDPISYQAALERCRKKEKDDINKTLEDLEITEKISGFIHSSDADYANYLKDLDKVLLELTDKAAPDILKDITSHIFTERGKLAETRVIDGFEREMNKIVNNRNNKFHKRYVDLPNGNKYVIGGRVDGITDDKKLVEVKNRQYRLFDKIPVYEKIQIHAYMFLTGITECHYVQCYRDKSESEVLSFDQTFWTDVRDKLDNFVQRVASVLGSTEKQDALIADNQFAELQEDAEEL